MKDYSDVEVNKFRVGAITVRMVLQPKSLDTIVATNLHADILSDLAATLSSSIGITPSSNLDPTHEPHLCLSQSMALRLMLLAKLLSIQ